MYDNNTFIKINDDTLVNQNYIQWMKQVGDCIYICNKVYGCDEKSLYGTYKICKSGDNFKSYSILKKKFNEYEK
jgi:hypothetical protein